MQLPNILNFRVRSYREDLPSGAGLDGKLAEEAALPLGELARADQLPDEVHLRHDIARVRGAPRG